MGKRILLVLFIGLSALQMQAQGGHKIKFKIKNLNDSIVYLARYYGDNKYIKDTILTKGKEEFTVEGDQELECGLYMIVREKRNSYFEFIVQEQKFSLETDTTDFIKTMKFKNSPSNTKLYEYFNYSIDLEKRIKEISDSSKNKTEEKKADKSRWHKFLVWLRLRPREVEEKTVSIDSLRNELIEYKKKFMLENPMSPMTVVFQLQMDVEFPKELLDDKSDEGDKKRYYYYLNHYWDNVDFSSNCLLRTPIFHGKLQRYFDKFVPQHYDSVPAYIDKVVELARANEENFKYVVNYLTFKWESGKEKRMCWDKVFHHMATKYYLCKPTQTPWVEDGQMAKIKTRADDLTYTLCGNPAINFNMKYYPMPGLYDTNGTMYDMYKLKADYVILWFWDSSCGHCKKQTPKLFKMYEEYKAAGKSIEVFSVNIEQESKDYKKYLRENGYNWINVQDTGHFSNFREYYDIYSTPVSYIVNKDRKIIGKRLDPEGMKNFLDQVFKEEEEEKLKAK